MNDTNIENTHTELMSVYTWCRVNMAEDKREMVAKISDGFAGAVIERRMPHFHRKMREAYRLLRGTVYVACGDNGHVLCQGETIAIEPGQIHFARAAGKPAWIEVESVPSWSSDDHFVLEGL